MPVAMPISTQACSRGEVEAAQEQGLSVTTAAQMPQVQQLAPPVHHRPTCTGCQHFASNT